MKAVYVLIIGVFAYAFTNAQCAPPTTGNSPYCNGFALNLRNGGYAYEPGGSEYNGLSAVTMEAWVYLTAYPANGQRSSIVSRGNFSSGQMLNFYLDNTGGDISINFNVNTTTGNGVAGISVTNNLPLNQWVHLAGTWSSGSEVRLFINGVQANLSAKVYGVLLSTNDSLVVGYNIPIDEVGMRGVVDEVAIFNTALPQSAINTYKSQVINSSMPYFNSLLSYFRFSERSGTTSRNQGCSGANLTLTGNAAFEGSFMPCGTLEFGTPTITATDNLFDKITVTVAQDSWLPSSIPTDGDVYRIDADGGNMIPIHITGTDSQQEDDYTSCKAEYRIELQQWIHTNYPISSISNYTVYSDTGRINTFGFAATHGSYVNKTVLTWNNIASVATNGFAIYRDGQQIAVLTSPQATSYTDLDGTPGVRYTYSIQPLYNGGAYPTCAQDIGWIKENGKLSGYVRSPLNAPVPGVTVTATGTVLGQTYTYTDTTDASGFYEIRNVFYNTQATYTLKPSKGSHQFNPDSLQRTLDIQGFNAPQANFTDTSVFTVSGSVYYPNQNGQPGCANHDVKILVNGQDVGIVTNTNGAFTYTAQDEGNYTFTPVYKTHTFNPPSQTWFINDDTSGVNFMNTTVDSLYLDLKGYCRQQISNTSKIEIVGVGSVNCFDSIVTLQGANVDALGLELPAQEYHIILTEVDGQTGANSPIIQSLNSLGENYRYLDMRERDSVLITRIDSSEPSYQTDTIVLPNGQVVVNNDTIITVDTVTAYDLPVFEEKFVYGGQVSIELIGLDTVCNGGYVFEQGNEYPVRIKLWRNYGFPGAVPCPVDTADITLFDDISDSSFLYYSVDTSFLKYNINPGMPNVLNTGAHPFQKFLAVYADVWDAGTANTGLWAIVEGNRSASPTFVTKTPELPFFVLHDPPGDGSSATLTQGTSLSYGYGTQVETGVNSNTYVNVSVGAEVPVPFTGIVFSAGGSLNLSLSSNNTNTSNQSVNTTFTLQNTFGTSSDDDFIGEDADVVVGASLNMIYGIADVVHFNDTTCQASVHQELIWGANDFATTYAYTIGHIKNTLIPQLTFLRDYYNNLYPVGDARRDSALVYQNYINVWQQVVDKNHQNIINGEQVENRSFSGGVTYSHTTSYENTNSLSINYQTSIEASIAAALNIGTEQNHVEAGTEVNLNWTTSQGRDQSVTNTKEVNYTMSDGDPGDFFSVDVKRDKVYGTPAFKVTAGTSSCPHEPGTQQRDLPQITVLNPYQQNVPITTPATFTVQMNNLSESLETRTYNVIVDPNSNLDGAIIHLGGQLISQFPATFTIPSHGSIFATMSVEPGPLAVNYTALKLIMYSPCDPDISDEATFRVDFQNTCSPITLFSPSNNWLVNYADSILTVTYGGYNVNDSVLLYVGLEIRRSGSGTWQEIPAAHISQVLLADTNLPYYTVNLDMHNFTDGNYEIRAYAQCSSGARSYSSVLEGVIDRTSLALFGTPSPGDGVLNRNEEVSVTFNEDLDCSHAFNTNPTVTLVRADNGDPVPFTYSCLNNKILYTIAQNVLDSLQNRTLIATVSGYYDLNGNQQSQPVSWSFVVNTGKVFWQPSGVSASVAAGSSGVITGTLNNVSSASQNFVLTSLPAWLSVAGVPVSIAQGSSLNINFDVNTSGLNPGIYNDTVFADVTSLGIQQSLYVQLTVYATAPAWTVVHYPSQMNIIANFSLSSANAPLSTDPNDKIGVFYGNECRGLANIQYSPAGNSYAAYITVYGNGNVSPQETFEFRMWDASEGREYKAVETQAFVPNAQIGQPLAPMILHPLGEVQRIPLSVGWNWVSTYLQPINGNVSNVMQYLQATEGNIIKTNDTYAQYSTALGNWTGTLSQIGWQKSYQILVDTPTQLQVIGTRLEDTVQIPVVGGWNWIGFPQSKVNTVTNFMSNFAKTNLDVLQSSTQFSTYQNNTWNGALQNMQPGRGYKYKSAATGNINVSPRSIPNWNPDIFGNEFNMNVTAVVEANGVESIGNFVVGAFINGTCVGVSSPQMAGTYPRVFLTLHGQSSNNGQPIEFLIYDYVTDSIYTPTYTPISFAVDGQQGTVENAYELTLATPLSIQRMENDQYMLYQNVPNPFNGQTIIAFDLPHETLATLQIFDYTGKLVAQPLQAKLGAGKHSVMFNQESLASGVYFYRLQTEDYSATKKMVVAK